MTSLDAPLTRIPTLEAWLTLSEPETEEKIRLAVGRLGRVLAEAEEILASGHVPQLEGLERCVGALCAAAATHCHGDIDITKALEASSERIGSLMQKIEAFQREKGADSRRGTAHSRAAMAYTLHKS